MDELTTAQAGVSRRRDKAVARWILAVLGVPIMSAAWIWLTLASTEQAEESAKAPSGDTSTADLFLMFGVGPLLIVHIAGVITLRVVAPNGPVRQGSGWATAVLLVSLASGIGLVVALVVNGGVLITPADGGYQP
jgi:hypothetical protein